MPKHIVYTKVTPLPSNVPRQLAIDMLHSHGEIIELNPLVTNHRPVPAPRDAARDEYFAQWYEIEEVITWGLGMRKKITFKGVFHDMPWGLQTHIYAPMGVDLRNKYVIGGNQPGEPREARELGIDAPAEGLYLREDVEITCNIALASFVKKETKQTLLTMIERMTKKAELLDDGVLEAMFEDGRLKTRNPHVAKPGDSLTTPSTATLDARRSSISSSSPTSPLPQHGEFPVGHTFTKYSQLPGRTGTHRSSLLSPQELDARPISNASSLSRPYNNAFEMEGSTTYIPAGDVKSGAPVIHAELADTSMAYVDPRRSSAQHSISTGPRSAQGSLPTSNRHSASSQHHHLSAQPAYTQPSAVPAPLLQAATHSPVQSRASSNASGYHITNPDQPRQGNTPLATPMSDSSQYSQDVAPQPLQPTSIHASYAPDPRYGADQKLADQVGGLNISGTAHAQSPRVDSATTGLTRTSKCPICSDFEGDSAAVSHHVNRYHFQ